MMELPLVLSVFQFWMDFNAFFGKRQFLSPQPGGYPKWLFHTLKIAKKVPNLKIGWKPFQKWFGHPKCHFWARKNWHFRQVAIFVHKKRHLEIILAIYSLKMSVFGKIYHYGKELGYRENKKCSETSERVGTTWEHALEFQKFSQ